MARVPGALIATSNYEVQVRKPLDARMLVPSYEDLLLKDNWVKTGTTQVIAYNGMLVAVANTSDVSANGLYMLFDANCTTALKSPDVTSETNWIKIGETSEIADIAARISSIESDLSNITENISQLDARVSNLENQEETVHTYGYKQLFPSTNEAHDGHVYIAADVQRTYIYSKTQGYVLVGAGFEEDDSSGELIIDGGDAD